MVAAVGVLLRSWGGGGGGLMADYPCTLKHVCGTYNITMSDNGHRQESFLDFFILHCSEEV